MSIGSRAVHPIFRGGAALTWLVVASSGVAAAAPAAAGPVASSGASRPVLVELFTSQGCSSCPAAEQLVRELPRLGFGRDRVLPLTFHVDYWDDLGWKDPFASPAFTARQRDYARARVLASPPGEEGISGIYTPQMIVDGRVHFSGSRRDVALAEIARAAARPPEVELDARADAGPTEVTVTASVRATGIQRRGADWVLRVALASREERTAVGRGENGGRLLIEAEVVRVLSPPLAIGLALEPLRVTLARPVDLGWERLDVVAFIQSAETLRVIAAAPVSVTVASAGGAAKR